MHDWAQCLLLLLLLSLLTPLLGHYMANLFQGKRTFLHPVVGWLEQGSYRIASVDPTVEMSWISYAKALLLFNGFGLLLLYGILITQHLLPFNPQDLPSVPPVLAFNIAISFVTNTNWQAYAGETTLTYASQMVGLTAQNFLSASTGIAAFLALVRGLTRDSTDSVGNFWVDIVRAIIYLFLPLSILLALFLASQGVIQNLAAYTDIHTLEGGLQTIPGGAVASQVAIKQLGTNGGGFFGVNGAHPFENPSALTSFIETLAILLIPAALTYTYGVMVDDRRNGILIFLVMTTFWLISLALSFYVSSIENPLLGGSVNFEGKETRLGVANSLLWITSTTTTANGSVNTALSSLSPLAGGLALLNVLLGELIFGGVGVGLCHMIIFIILTVFIAGLMVGRTPQYLGKRIDKQDMQWAVITILVPSTLTLIGAGISAHLPDVLATSKNQGPHGLTQIIYAFASAAGNNGSAFAGLRADNDYYELFLAIIMLMTRLSTLIPTLALAGRLASKKAIPMSIGMFSTNTPLFAVLLSSVIVIAGGLTFFPALSLGPIVEHMLMLRGIAF